MSSYSNVVFIVMGKRREFIDLNQERGSLVEFPSKKDAWLYPILFIVVGACFAPIFVGREYFLLFFTIPLAILFMWSWFSTKYIVEEETITIRSGPVKKRILIRDIKKFQIQKIQLQLMLYHLTDLKLFTARIKQKLFLLKIRRNSSISLKVKIHILK